ncbi:MAG: DNA primase [Acholeplasmataceae bacterium]|nr:DNA primase [Acholeplasmataceae bacterium]
MVNQSIIDKINNQTDIVKLVSEFVSLEKRGKNYFGLCPFHSEKTPSFSVSPEKNIAKCFSCGKGGGPINFYQDIKQISFQQALTELASRLGITIEVDTKKSTKNDLYYQIMEKTLGFYEYALSNTEQGKKALSYLKKRGVSTKSIKNFRIGYATASYNQLYEFLKAEGYKELDLIKLGLIQKSSSDDSYYDLFKDRIIFPIIDENNHVLGFSGRTLSKEETTKYYNTMETPIFKKGEIVYNLKKDLKTDEINLFEGFFDVISSYQAGLENGVATMGTALTERQARLLRRYFKTVTIIYDGDQAGVAATKSAMTKLRQANLNVNVLTLPDSLDPDEFIKQKGADEFLNYYNTNIKDYYKYTFDNLLVGINLDNSNQVTNLIQKTTQMLQGASEIIYKIYEKELEKLLGFEVLLTTKPLPSKKTKPKIKRSSQFESAEKNIMVELLRSPKYLKEVKKNIPSTDFVNPIAATLRIKLEDYYEKNQYMTLSNFFLMLEQDEKDYADKALKGSLSYIEGLDIVKEQIIAWCDKIIEYRLVRKREELSQKIDETDNHELKLKLMEKKMSYKQIKKRSK